MTKPILEVRSLRTLFHTDDGVVKAVDGIDFSVAPGEVFAIVGESGSGKTVTALSILDLVPKPHGEIVEGEVLFQGRDLRKLKKKQMRAIRGNQIAMVFQDPLTALNPVYSVGGQVAEVFRVHRDMSKKAAWKEAVELLRVVGIPRPEDRAHDYPHSFSGGMRQRAMIAMAVALGPELLIADEPTTALDVTIQAQVMEVFQNVRDEFGMAIMLITHDLGVVADVAERVMVMYAGRVAEVGTTEDIYKGAKHPYTWGLMSSVPRLDMEKKRRLVPIGGAPPSLIRVPPGCPFHPRCPYRQQICVEEVPEMLEVNRGHLAACHFAREAGWAPRTPRAAEGS